MLMARATVATVLDAARRQDLVAQGFGRLLMGFPLARLTSLRVGGPAEALLFPASLGALAAALAWCRRHAVPWQILGRGTNVLVADQGLAGLSLVLGRRLGGIHLVGAGGGQALVQVGAGCSLARLVAWTASQGLAGLEWAAGIPGSVGGAVAMNAGAWGKEMSEVLAEVLLADAGGGAVGRLAAGRLAFAYRRTRLPAGAVVGGALIRLRPDEPAAIAARLGQVRRQRQERQPQDLPSAGSFFKNPPGQAAGRLIEAAGLKGRCQGGAQVSPRHANFLVNTGHAQAQDFLDLMTFIQATVLKASGVWLEPEVRILGWATDKEEDR
ncbi:MAG: UDP-N-acetylmuramate dehydrogenase [Thermodesulfobacteriota bacterium]